MSLEPKKKPSLLAPLADQYKLAEGGPDRILAKIQTAHLRDAGAASPASVAGKLSLLVGSACAALAIVGVTIQLSSPSDPSPVVAPSAVSAQPAVMPPNESAREPETVVAVPSVAVDSLPTVAEAPPSPRVPSKRPSAPAGVSDAPPTVAPAASGDTLQQEARLITDARQALELGDGDTALARLAEHARLFPNGWFAADRAAERIVVLCSLGRRAEAVKEAAVFLESRPKSPLTRRVEASCAGQVATKAGN
ncbi:MAG: hypothetical protein K0S65_1368 [Labilithrix sp.]|nr:hypothetical protein [Labilithrix sp.]